MGEQIIQARPGKPRDFDIPADAADSDQKKVTLILPEAEDPGRYVIVKKDIPGQARQKGRDKNITWINNFGIKFRGNFVEHIDYQVVVDVPPPGMNYFYFDGVNVQSFADADVDESGSQYPGQWVLTLHSGDPPVGWGGG